jgi:hypothetical protein
MGGVLFDELFLVIGNFVGYKNRVRGAGRNTGAAIDTSFGVDVKLGRCLKVWFIFFGVDTVGGADFHAKFIFDAIVGDYISHDDVS